MRKAVRDIFGVQAFGPAVFYTFPGGLRFALGEGGTPFDQVLTALRKASTVCRDVFADADVLTVCLGQYAPDTEFAVRSTLRQLALAGVFIPRERDIHIDVQACDAAIVGGADVRWLSIVFALPVSKLENVLWCAVATNVNIVPNPGCRIHLVNCAAQLMVHPYDERGMDVVGPNRALLGQLYRKHNAWLLDYDRGAMDAAFTTVSSSEF